LVETAGFGTQGDIALSLPLVAHPRLTADKRFSPCRSSSKLARKLANFVYPQILSDILLTDFAFRNLFKNVI